MTLIVKIRNAVNEGHLPPRFTTADFKKWMEYKNILKDDGEEYKKKSIDAILSNSDVKNKPTTNKNKKSLGSEFINGHKIYFL